MSSNSVYNHMEYDRGDPGGGPYPPPPHMQQYPPNPYAQGLPPPPLSHQGPPPSHGYYPPPSRYPPPPPPQQAYPPPYRHSRSHQLPPPPNYPQHPYPPHQLPPPQPHQPPIHVQAPPPRQKSKAYSSTIAAHSDDLKYQGKYKDLKRKVRDIELDNDKLHLKVLKAKQNIQRIRLERAILYERLASLGQIPTPPIAGDSGGFPAVSTSSSEHTNGVGTHIQNGNSNPHSSRVSQHNSNNPSPPPQIRNPPPDEHAIRDFAQHVRAQQHGHHEPLASAPEGSAHNRSVLTSEEDSDSVVSVKFSEMADKDQMSKEGGSGKARAHGKEREHHQNSPRPVPISVKELYDLVHGPDEDEEPKKDSPREGRKGAIPWKEVYDLYHGKDSDDESAPVGKKRALTPIDPRELYDFIHAHAEGDDRYDPALLKAFEEEYKAKRGLKQLQPPSDDEGEGK